MTNQNSKPEEPDYETNKLLKLASELNNYGLKTQMKTEDSSPSLVLNNGEIVSISGGYFIGTFGRTFSVLSAVELLLGLETEPRPPSSASGMKWGWLSLALTCYPGVTGNEPGIGSASFGWHRPSRSATIARVPAEKLRRWAQAGLLSHIHEPRRHHRYLRAELDFIKEIGAEQEVTTPALRAYAEAALYGFLTADTSGRIIRCA
ncbi:hypothetical protein BZB76_6358 [Actinomadura pelletieri DSM 43383]|uniref:Uncharacterized protein n=1 Tax=Actinomadura pelletieri DSM 43383 TaxID=1120940 RepID=A0A495Q9X8_9ACTN|nr:hypothetical protein [Actinomadura pelletieri]RKS68114.1 hypothetical protein BZB76_6358 [Actinomadura pelletieri DSM 43383]